VTTVAWDGKTLAADRQVSSGSAVYRATGKLHAIPGGVIGCCGSVPQIQRALNWIRAGMKGDAPELDEFGAISVIDGEVAIWDDETPIPIGAGERIAIGSGGSWAMAAMDFGKSAIEAVEYAATRDHDTGCGVDSVQPTMRSARKRGR
jgi:ATP-dependent protease HslVU (ClpYQ) peptidase subunit